MRFPTDQGEDLPVRPGGGFHSAIFASLQHLVLSGTWVCHVGHRRSHVFANSTPQDSSASLP